MSYKIRGWFAWPLIGFLALIFFLIYPPIGSLTDSGMKAVGVLLFTFIAWVSIDVTYPSFLCIVLFIFVGVLSPEKAFSVSFGSWIVLFLMGCFGLSEGLRATGFSRRFALWFLTHPINMGRPWVLLTMFLLGCTIMGSILSSTVTCIVFMAIGATMLEHLGYKKGDAFASVIMLGVAWASTASHAMTPIGHAVNILAIEWIRRDFGYNVTFLQWMLIGIPLGIIVLIMTLIMFRLILGPDIKVFNKLSENFILEEKKSLGPMTKQEKIAIGIFLTVLTIWIFPAIFMSIFPELSVYISNLGYATPAIAGAGLLCFVRVENKPIMTFYTWMNGGVEWGTIVLIAAVMTIGNVVSDATTGIPLLLISIFEPVIQNVPVTLFLLISILWVILQTNIMSNLVSMTLAYNILIPIATTSGIVNPVALSVFVAMGSSYAFSLPSATTTTALIIGSKWVSVPFMARYGLLMIIPIVFLFAFCLFPWVSFIIR